MELEQFIDKEELQDVVARRVSEALITDLRKDIKDAASSEISGFISREIAQIVGEVLVAPFQHTNSYGEPKGSPVTLKELVIGKAKDFLTKKTHRKSSNYRGKFEETSYDATHTGFEALVAPMMQEEIEKEIHKHLKEMVEAVKREAAMAAARAFSREFGLAK